MYGAAGVAAATTLMTSSVPPDAGPSWGADKPLGALQGPYSNSASAANHCSWFTDSESCAEPDGLPADAHGAGGAMHT